MKKIGLTNNGLHDGSGTLFQQGYHSFIRFDFAFSITANKKGPLKIGLQLMFIPHPHKFRKKNYHWPECEHCSKPATTYDYLPGLYYCEDHTPEFTIYNDGYLSNLIHHWWEV